MSKDKRDLRLGILRRRARLVQIIKQLMLADLDKMDVAKIIKIGSQLESLKEQISPVGGAPKSWS